MNLYRHDALKIEYDSDMLSYIGGMVPFSDEAVDNCLICQVSCVQNNANMIAHREGFGDILAEGLLRAGERLGEEARAHFSNEVSGLNRYGERIFNLQRGILLREGRRPPKADCPEEFNFTDPVKSVFMNPEVIIPGACEEVISRKGQTLDRNIFETMRKEFYELRGWDAESGLQKIETLEKLGLSELVQDLQKTGNTIRG